MSRRLSRSLLCILLILTFCLGSLPVARAVQAQDAAPPLPAGIGSAGVDLPEGVEVTTDAAGNVTFLRGSLLLPPEVQSAEVGASTAALAFVSQYAGLFGVADPARELHVAETTADTLGFDHVRLTQMVGDVPVYGAGMAVHLRTASGEVTAASSSYVPGLQAVTVQPQLDAPAAVALAQKLLPNGSLVRQPQLAVFPGVGSRRSAANAHLAWLVELRDLTVPARTIYVLRADNGALLDALDRLYADGTADTAALPAPPSQQIEPASPNQPAIVGGEEVTPGTYPWMVALAKAGTPNGYDAQFCGGTLILPSWILTAGHCVYNDETGAVEDPDTIDIILGRHQLDTEDGERIRAAKIFLHESYVDATLNYDIAIIKLSTPSAQETLPLLASTQDAALYAEGQMATVTGWGALAEDGEYPTRLHQVTVPLVAETTCKADLPERNMSVNLCAGYRAGGKDSCQGDSGGPLYVRTQFDVWMQVGIVSGGIGCAQPDHYGFYTKVPAFRDWIRNTINGETAAVCATVQGVAKAECDALAMLYQSTNGQEWLQVGHGVPWFANNAPCTWRGVTCNAGKTAVTGLALGGIGLSGRLPAEVRSLTRLQALDLSANELSGAVPVELGQLAELRVLDLHSNSLTGWLPPEVGNLTNLTKLDLSSNKLNGVIHPRLGRLAALETLNLSFNQLRGGIPAQLGDLGRLKTMNLSYNQLQGSLPAELGKLKLLEELNLSYNQLAGAIPGDLGNAVRLAEVKLQHNALSGSVPGSLGSLANLRVLLLQENQLGGSLPPVLGNLTQLFSLHVAQNPLFGPLPLELKRLALTSFSFDGTGLCIPDDDSFQTWLDSISTLSGTDLACSAIQNPMRLATYTANNLEELPGMLVRVDDGPAIGDRDVDGAHAFASATWTYYQGTHNRNSYDNKGAVIMSTAHYGRNYMNAFWDGKQMVYGDSFPVRDVVGHELSHAVIERTANLEYRWQSGALNESFADIFGAMVDRDDWLMGEDLPSSVLGDQNAIRDLQDPARLDQPAHTEDWVETCSDNEGVHTNSGIFNKAYYNVATAAGMSKEKAERVFYRALVTYLDGNSSFADARAGVLQAATDIYGKTSVEYKAAEAGLNAAGITAGWYPPENSCSCAATVALSPEHADVDAVSASATIGTLYEVRDQVLAETPAGVHYRTLYYQHTEGISALLRSDEALRRQGAGLLLVFAPGLNSLANGRGNEQVITAENTSAVLAYLEALEQRAAAQGNLALAHDIQVERQRIDWPQLPGMTYSAAWDYFNSLTRSNTIFLPQIGR